LVHEFHTSERKSFRGCRRRWSWIFRDNYYPKTTAKPLDFGTAYHKALEVYYDPDSGQFPRSVMLEQAIAAFATKNEKQRLVAQEANQFKTPDEVDEDFRERLELGVGMLRHFGKYISPREDANWHPVKVEIEFMVPIPHPDTGINMECTCDTCWTKYEKWHEKNTDVSPYRDEFLGLPVVYAGRLDCLGEDEHGDLYIIDWKTAARIPDDHSFLDLDDQVGSYCWALWSIGMNIRGFIYHEQKKGFPVPPKENKHVRLGRKFSVAENQDTDYETYLATVSEHDEEAFVEGRYASFLTFLKDFGQKFYHRQVVHKSEEELANLGKLLGLEVLDMLADDLRIYPNPGRWSCGNCAFSQPCIEQNRGGDYVYGLETMFEKREAYYLREEPSTDKKSAQ
jgi:hypothetical protein